MVLAREIERRPKVLLVGQPTRGVDIGAIEFIHRRLIALRDAGVGILLVSVELEEIMNLSDRILAMCGGQITGERRRRRDRRAGSRPPHGRRRGGSMMEPRISLMTLGVADLAKVARLLRGARLEGLVGEPARGGFFPGQRLALALCGRAALAKDAEAEDRPTGFSAITLAYNARCEEEVDEVFAAALKAGAQAVKTAQDVSGAAIRAISPIPTGTSGRWRGIRSSRSTRRAISPCRRDA